VLPRDDRKFLAALDDYLNFFEFIGYLQSARELKTAEIKAMFDYSLKQIGQNAPIREYLIEYGYEHLNALLSEMRYSVVDHGG
jgi:hypothetical protein